MGSGQVRGAAISTKGAIMDGIANGREVVGCSGMRYCALITVKIAYRSCDAAIILHRSGPALAHFASGEGPGSGYPPQSPFGTDKSDQAPAANPHRSTPPSGANSPAVSSLEADACLRAPLTPVTGRRPKTLNDSGRSR